MAIIENAGIIFFCVFLSSLTFMEITAYPRASNGPILYAYQWMAQYGGLGITAAPMYHLGFSIPVISRTADDFRGAVELFHQ